jgi:hypothetical protein
MSLSSIDVVDGALLALVAAVLVVGGRFLVAYRREEDLGEAADITAEAVIAVVAGAFGVGAMGLVELSQLLGGLTSWIGMHPFGVSNGILAGLGAVTAWAGITVSPQQWLGVGLLVPAVVLLLYDLEEGGMLGR